MSLPESPSEKSSVENGVVSLEAARSEYARSMDESFEKLLAAADVDYTQCDEHAQEMMINTVACIACQVLICPLCLCNKHIGHNIISLTKLRECKALRCKLDDDLNRLQVLQEQLSNQLKHRRDMQAAIEESSKDLTEKLNKAFDRLLSIITAKREENRQHVCAFTDRQLATVRDEVATLERRYTNSARMIQKVITFSTAKMGTLLNESQTLPEQLKMTLKECQLLKNIDSYDAILPGKKFARVIPSLETLSNICQTMHPEATKVIWSKVPPKENQLEANNSKSTETDDVDVPKRKRGRTSAAVKRQRMEKADELLKSTVNGADQKQETPASNV